MILQANQFKHRESTKLEKPTLTSTKHRLHEVDQQFDSTE